MIQPFRFQIPSDGAISKESAIAIAESRWEVSDKHSRGAFEDWEGFDGFEYDAGRGYRGVLQLTDFLAAARPSFSI